MSAGRGWGEPAAPSGFLDEELMKVLSHPLRVKLLARLCEGEATFGQLVAIAGESSSNVNYHLGELQDAGLVTATRGGHNRTSKVYRSDLDTILPADVWDGFPAPLRRHVAAGLMRRLCEDAGASLEAGRFGPEASLTVTPVVVDPEGAIDIAAVLEWAQAKVRSIQAASDKRSERRSHSARSMTVALIAFESLRPVSNGARAAQSARA